MERHARNQWQPRADLRYPDPPSQVMPRAYQPDLRSSFVSATSKRDSGSHYVSGITSPGLDSSASYGYDHRISESVDTSPIQSRMIRQASVGKMAKPNVTSVKTPSRMNSAPKRPQHTVPSTDQTATMEALTAAIQQGLSASAHPAHKPMLTRTNTDQSAVRMPFATDSTSSPPSPTSIYTDLAGTYRKRDSIPISSYNGYHGPDSKPSTIAEQTLDVDDHHRMQDLPTPLSIKSAMSSQHLLRSGAEPKGMSNKFAADRRPPPLDIGAVREMEKRGSTTSLSDLIRRATRLASNLDRGKTASRLGHLDMFGFAENPGKRRESTYSDMLAAFPPPADGTPNQDRPTTMWPGGEKGFAHSKTSLANVTTNNGSSTRRKCCGLQPWVFVIIVIAVIIILAAAVLVPVFLLVIVPREKSHGSVSHCESTFTCQNGGISVSMNSTCSCICMNGFTGDTCTVAASTDCTAATLKDGPIEYNNATLGSALLSVINNASTTFDIPLNISILLSTMSSNNLSCASENSLVEFSGTSKRQEDVLTRGLLTLSAGSIKRLNMPDDMIMRDAPTVTIQRRQTQSTNGIVFATSSQTQNAAASGATATGTSTSPSPGTNSSSTPTASSSATNEQIQFAGVSVLYVLEQHGDIALAVSANQALASYFKSPPSNGNGTVDIVSGSKRIAANLVSMELTLADGSTLGGNRST